MYLSRLMIVVVVCSFVMTGGCDRSPSGSNGGGASPGEPALVVYCAHDSVYSEPILAKFQAETGTKVEIRFDTEATKSLGLVELLVNEKDNPRCDVFWNNEQLGVMRLKEQGVLEPYKGPGWERMPSGYKDPDGHWTGFAARMRVWIVNTDSMPATPEAIASALEGDLSRVALAKPLYGTTRTHYTVLWDLWGAEKLKAWHADWRQRDVAELAGNATVKNAVGAGASDFGLTDSSDYFVGKDAGLPVGMVPFRLEDGRVIAIPNTVAMIKGTKRPEAARQLMGYLLSRETELALAASKSRQIPLGALGDAELPEDVKPLAEAAQNAYPLSELGPAVQACLDWLKSEYVQ